jgi:hypothetical protein
VSPPRATVKGLNIDLSLSETSEDEESQEKQSEENNNQPLKVTEEEVRTEIQNSNPVMYTFPPTSQQTDQLVQQQIDIEAQLTRETTQEMPNFQPAPFFYNVELLTTLENPVLRYDYSDGSLQWNDLGLKDNEQADHSENLEIVVPEP